MIERLVATWEDAWFAVVATIACLSASFVCCPQVSFEFVPKVGVEITAATSSPGPMMVPIEDDDREFQEDVLELWGLPGVLLVLPSSHIASQITPPQSFSPSALTRARYPLRC